MDSAINTQIVSPFDGKPETRQLTSQDGRVIFEIIAKELTPLRAKFANALAWIIALAAAGFGFFTVFQMVDPHGFHIIAFGCGPLIAIPLFEWGIGKLLRKETAMVLTGDEFAFQDSKNWKRFNRQIDHRFSLLPHDKTRDEAEDNEFAVRKAQANGKVIRKKTLLRRFLSPVLRVYGPAQRYRGDIWPQRCNGRPGPAQSMRHSDEHASGQGSTG